MRKKERKNKGGVGWCSDNSALGGGRRRGKVCENRKKKKEKKENENYISRISKRTEVRFIYI